MTLEFKIEPPYPIVAKLLLPNGNILPANVIFMEHKGCLIEMKAPFFKTGDKLTLDFNLPGEPVINIKEVSVILKIYIQFKEGKPHYLAEVHFKNHNTESIKLIEKFLHEFRQQKKIASIEAARTKKNVK